MLSRGEELSGLQGLKRPAGSSAQALTASTQIGCLVQRTDLDLARPRHRVGATLGPRQRLGHVLHFPQPETRDQLFGFGKRPVDHPAARAVERDALAVRRGLESIGREQDAGCAQLVVEAVHGLHHFGGPWREREALLAVFGGFHEDHHTHVVSFFIWPGWPDRGTTKLATGLRPPSLGPASEPEAVEEAAVYYADVRVASSGSAGFDSSVGSIWVRSYFFQHISKFLQTFFSFL